MTSTFKLRETENMRVELDLTHDKYMGPRLTFRTTAIDEYRDTDKQRPGSMGGRIGELNEWQAKDLEEYKFAFFLSPVEMRLLGHLLIAQADEVM